jgi:thiol-disulfide isomerase/thioredoxin
VRLFCTTILLLLMVAPLGADDKTGEPSNEKAQKSYKEAQELLQKRQTLYALESFKKANKQDDGRCVVCQKMIIKYGMEFGDWKAVEQTAEQVVAQAEGETAVALAHFQFAMVMLNEGIQRHKDELFARAHEEALKALAAHANFPDAVFLDGRTLAYLKQDEAAKARFEQYTKMKPASDPIHQRAERFASRPELARARMSPAFAVTTLDGQHIAMDDLQGKVVLVDFWATWCEPCREALPHIRNVAKKFQGQPLVILSVSLDIEAGKWKDFVNKNEMTWPQYNDGGFDGTLAKLFGVTSIPHTFTIDADGVLQDEHIGDGSIEGKIKKLIERARETQSASGGSD